MHISLCNTFTNQSIKYSLTVCLFFYQPRYRVYLQKTNRKYPKPDVYVNFLLKIFVPKNQGIQANYLSDPIEARGCSTIPSAINSLFE